MYKIKTLNRIEEFLTKDSDSTLCELAVPVEYMSNTQLLVRSMRISDLEHDLFLLMYKLSTAGDDESTAMAIAMYQSIKFQKVSNGILIYIED